jgi:hypothetical protein
MTEPIDRILRLPAVLDATGLSRATLYRKINQGTFPKKIWLARVSRNGMAAEPYPLQLCQGIMPVSRAPLKLARSRP